MVHRVSLLVCLSLALINLSGVWALDNLSDTATTKKVTSDQGRTNAQSPVLNVSPREIDLGVIGPDEGVKGTFALQNVGSGSLNWHANEAEGWTSLDKKKLSGALKNGIENLQVHISFPRKTLNPNGVDTYGKNLVQMSLNSLNEGTGFCHAFLFADAFVVEVFGRRYEKRRKALLYTGEGTVTHGTKIIFGKLFPAT